MESRVPQHIPGVSSSIMVQPLLDSRVPYGRLQHPLTVYPIDQMKSSHVENDYIDSPAAVCQQPQHQLAHHHHHPAPQPKHHLPTAASTGSTRQSDAPTHHNHHQQHHHSHSHNHHHHHHHLHHHHHHPHTQDSTHPWISFSGRPSSISSSSSTSSDQRLLDHAAPTPVLDTASNTTITSCSSTATSSSSSSSSSSLPLAALSLGQGPANSGGGGNHTTGGLHPKPQLGTKSTTGTDLKTAVGLDGGGRGGPVGSLLPAEAKHLLLCDRCGKCRCTECTLPRPLPSCWVCHQACLCSAQNLVDAATCMCLVKGVFYHCTEDEDGEEGSCADRPCSCAPSHRCARWSFMAVLSLALPCLLCYLPAVGCAKLSQKCYDGARRPGCRCKAPAAASKAGMAGILGKPSGGLGGGGELDKQAAS